MTIRSVLFAVALAVTLPALAAAQTGAPGATPAPQPDPQVGTCAQAQPAVSANLDAALKRLDEARQANSTAAFRAAADDLQAALLDTRARLAPCASMQPAGGDAHAGHVMPNTTAAPPAAPGTPAMAPGSTRPAPAAAAPGAPAPAGADPHAGHAMPGAPAPAAGSGAPARPAAQPAPSGGPGAGAPGAAHTGHTMAAMPAGDLVKDPRCQQNVNPASSPQVSHEGRTYYFCSEIDRQRFIADPARYLGAAGAGDPHAGMVMPPARGGSAKPAAADPHAGMAMPPARGGAAKPAAGDPHAGMAMPGAPKPAAAPAGANAPATSLDALKCREEVDGRTAPRMLYQGQMYYFCSDDERATFAKNPARYVGSAPAPAAAPAHGH